MVFDAKSIIIKNISYQLLLYFQRLVIMLETYLKKPLHENEKHLLNKYARSHMPFYIGIFTNYLIGITVFSLGPVLIENQKLPINSWYPYIVDSQVVYVVLYTQQVIGIMLTISIAFLDFIAITFLWYLTARIELLQNDFRLVFSETELKACVHKHQELIW